MHHLIIKHNYCEFRRLLNLDDLKVLIFNYRKEEIEIINLNSLHNTSNTKEI